MTVALVVFHTLLHTHNVLLTRNGNGNGFIQPSDDRRLHVRVLGVGWRRRAKPAVDYSTRTRVRTPYTYTVHVHVYGVFEVI